MREGYRQRQIDRQTDRQFDRQLSIQTFKRWCYCQTKVAIGKFQIVGAVIITWYSNARIPIAYCYLTYLIRLPECFVLGTRVQIDIIKLWWNGSANFTIADELKRCVCHTFSLKFNASAPETIKIFLQVCEKIWSKFILFFLSSLIKCWFKLMSVEDNHLLGKGNKMWKNTLTHIWQ